MTRKFDSFGQECSAETFNQEEKTTDRFELLSAFIDGELSPAQRNQVQAWLDHDPEIKQLYTQLLALQCQMQHSVAPPSQKSVAEITAGVFHSIDRRRRRKLIWGGSAIAASVFAAIGLVPGAAPPAFRLANRQPPGTLADSPVMLAVAIDKPTVNIPKAINNRNIEAQQPIKN